MILVQNNFRVKPKLDYEIECKKSNVNTSLFSISTMTIEGNNDFFKHKMNGNKANSVFMWETRLYRLLDQISGEVTFWAAAKIVAFFATFSNFIYYGKSRMCKNMNRVRHSPNMDHVRHARVSRLELFMTKSISYAKLSARNDNLEKTGILHFRL